jgi:dienelactone hydrolase
MLGFLVPSTAIHKARQFKRERQIRESPMAIDALCRREFLWTLSMLPPAIHRLSGQGVSAFQTVDERIRQLSAEAPLAMKFRGTSLRDCRTWQVEFGTKLRSLLGPHQPPQEWKTIVGQVTELEDHRREELTLTAEGHSPLPLYLLVPTGSHKTRAGILALHGHGDYGHHPVAGRDDISGVAEAIRTANYDYGRQLVRKGYVVAIPCLTPFGPRLGNRDGYGGQDPCADTFIRLQLLGKLLIAENLRDCRWALELLAKDRRVDSKRLGCVGLSYGGRMTMLTAALEPRIRVAVISGALNAMQERISVPYSCGAQVIPGLLQFGDTPEIASLIAPRACLWEVGRHDKLLPPEWVEEALQRIRRAYRAYGVEEELRVDRFDGGHRWNGELAQSILEKVLG